MKQHLGKPVLHLAPFLLLDDMQQPMRQPRTTYIPPKLELYSARRTNAHETGLRAADLLGRHAAEHAVWDTLA
ncbi:hypothetical protein CNMCM6106_009040 [Aspergillus hiratsukae]|uniref:Uncharacterized protein n=1 Tax=Aspergillus hiratsukae TaxID=1194566 RepID=A0A8H6V422_9EURO|nr:hypothetical protein CNMCM6106_009040 [Aspergillus hiratsukae]